MISKHDLIFQQWVASLQGRDRTRNAIQANFEDLFSSLKAEGLSLEGAYEYLGKATKAHQPTDSLVRNVYRKLKVAGRSMPPEKEFQESWCKDIADKANAAFFSIYPVEVKEPEPEDPIVHGSMTLKEYKAQRTHADAYPRLDLEEFQKRMRAEDYNPVADITAALGNNGHSH
jgi:hypothetical protein